MARPPMVPRIFQRGATVIGGLHFPSFLSFPFRFVCILLLWLFLRFVCTPTLVSPLVFLRRTIRPKLHILVIGIPPGRWAAICFPPSLREDVLLLLLLALCVVFFPNACVLLVLPLLLLPLLFFCFVCNLLLSFSQRLFSCCLSSL